MTCTWFIINPVPTDFLCVMTHTVVLFIQDGKTALDRARYFNRYKVVQYLEEVGKYNNKLDLILYIIEHCVCMIISLCTVIIIMLFCQ